MKSVCILGGTDGSLREINISQEDISSFLGGEIKFVGGIPELNVFIVALKESCLNENKFYRDHPSHFHDVPCGLIVFIASDKKGKEIDISTVHFWQLFPLTCEK